MFCDNCGRQLNDGAKFCESCGARVGGADAQPVNQGFVQNAPQNVMYTQPAYMAPVQTARKPKSRAWIIIIIAVVVAAGIGVGLFFLLSPKNPTMTVNGKPTLTVNGENIPVEVSGLAELRGEYKVVFVGKKENDIYLVAVNFARGNPSAGKTYNLKDLGETIVWFEHTNDEENIHNYLNTDRNDFTEVTVSVGDYAEQERISISVSGEFSYDGVEYKFSLSGNAEYCPNDKLIADYRDLIARAEKVNGEE